MAGDHRKLRAFELADGLVLLVYGATEGFPEAERYGLTTQLRRAAVSVACNLVEGVGRRSDGDFIRFVAIALGSLREVGYLVDLSCRLGYLPPSEAETLLGSYEETARVMQGLLRRLRMDRPATRRRKRPVRQEYDAPER